MQKIFLTLSLLLSVSFLFAQTDTTKTILEQEEEDYSIYDDFESTGEEVKRYANAKINGLSPQRFVSIAWDFQTAYDLNFSSIGSYGIDAEPNASETGKANYTGGFRFNSAIPVISKSNILWQSGINFMDVRYNVSDIKDVSSSTENAPGLSQILNDKGLRNLNWTNTVYKPLNEKSFLLFQLQTELSGNFDIDLQPFSTIRYSAAVLWGKRPNDNKQWAVGLSRTYRVGNMNYIPVVMYNWTSNDKKWGTEILFPARAHGRYNFDKNTLLLFGYELEGQSYRIDELSAPNSSLEIRRGELRPRLDFQKKLFGFFWGGFQVGYRINYSYDADMLADNKEFFRGFFGEQDFAMKNTIGNALYFNFSISFVSP